MYSQYLRYGYYSGLKEFLDENTGNKNIEPIIDRKYYEYDRTFDLYSSIFGADQVYAIPMEMMVSRPEDLAKKLSEATGKKVRVPDSTNTSIRENAALSGWAKKSLRIANRFVPQDSRWTQKSRKLSPNSIASKVNNITPNWIRRRQKLNEQELICRTLGKHYADSNRRLGNIIGIDLASLGYET